MNVSLFIRQRKDSRVLLGLENINKSLKWYDDSSSTLKQKQRSKKKILKKFGLPLWIF